MENKKQNPNNRSKTSWPPLCPFCGTETYWSTSETRSDFEGLELPAELDSCTDVFTCPYCGSTVEATECYYEMRDGYPYWQKNNEYHGKETDSTTDK